MKKIATLLFILVLIFVYSDFSAQTKETPQPKQHGKNFVDKNGDGYNDNAPDHDGDGIPNGLDPDFLAIRNRNAYGKFVDLDGDGIKDQVGKGRRGQTGKHGLGPADGTGNKGMMPKDGTGNGMGTQTGNNFRGKGWGKK